MTFYTFLTGNFLILSVWFLCVVSEECPPAEMVAPCTCDEEYPLDITCKHITRMEVISEVLARSGDIRFKYFNLENSTIMFLPAESLISKRIDGLTISNTRLMGMFDTFPSSSNTMRFLWLENVVIQRGIKWDYFKKMVKLEVLDILNMNVKTLGKEFIDNAPPGLSSITLRNTNIAKLADGVFVGLEKLKTIRMERNKIKELKRNFFDTPSYVEHLSFNDNLIEELPDDIFTAMPSLMHLSFERNKIQRLPENIYLPAFERVPFGSVEGNPIICDCRLEWITRIPIQENILGACGDDSIVKKGVNFKNLTKRDFKYCHIYYRNKK